MLKAPGSQWLETGEDGVNNYSSYKAEVKTEFGNYPDCIAVSKKFVPTDGDLDSPFASYYTISYYAKGVGLVKVETYNTSTGEKASTENSVLDKQLIDRYSEYSFSKQ